MKKILAFLFDLAYSRIGRGANTVHDDRLRANQFGDQSHSFSYWRALVS
jgi:hypothetical protein